MMERPGRGPASKTETDAPDSAAAIAQAKPEAPAPTTMMWGEFISILTESRGRYSATVQPPMSEEAILTEAALSSSFSASMPGLGMSMTLPSSHMAAKSGFMGR